MGQVKMRGVIYDPACAIDLDTFDQTVNMVPAYKVIRGGQSLPQPFNIKLSHCTLSGSDLALPNWKKFEVTFDGLEDGLLFAVRGSASGIALKIADSLGQVAIPGQVLPATILATKEMYLNYSMTLVPNQGQFKEGYYFSTLRFKLGYF